MRFTHGMSKSSFYTRYMTMVARTTNPNSQKYPNYGARGIKCEWDSFERFKDDMYESYLAHLTEHGEQNTSIERIDNDRNYSKENCRWATYREQASNTRKTKLITHNGKTHSESEWSRIMGIKRTTIAWRLKAGYSVEETLTNKRPKHGK